MEIEVKEIKVNSLIGRSSIADYCINPYIGCQHACKYCYANFYTKKIYGIKKQWGSYVYVKINYLDLLKREILLKKRGCIYISSLTDAYQPIEKKYKIMRKILEILQIHQWPIIIQTKSSLVLRDFDLISKFKRPRVGVTVISLNSDISKRYEPFADSIDKRLNVIKEAKENKIENYVFVGPILPFTDFKEITDLIIFTKEYCNFFYFDKFNIKPDLLEFLEKEFLKEKTLNDMEKYYEEVKKKIKEFCIKNKINFEVLF
ncbi:MAG: radical SAM protein [Candidatus Aenigmatarchaeota archaeon]